MITIDVLGVIIKDIVCNHRVIFCSLDADSITLDNIIKEEKYCLRT